MMDNLDGTSGVFEAAERLADLGLASREPRGINDVGMRTLTDLLTVLIFQAGGGASHSEQVASATSRAALAAVADLYAEMAGTPTTGVDTVKLLAEAGRLARSAG